MSRALASTEPAVEPAPAPASTVARAETRLIALLVGGLMALGAIVQLFVPPGPLAAVATAGGLSVVLIGVSLVVRGRLLKTLGGFRLAAVTLVALAVAAALGTLILQNKPEAFYRAEYARVGALITGLGFDDIFHSLWFAALLALTISGLVTSAILRWPITLKNAGFFSVHLGTVVVLAGAALSALFATKGRVDLRVGAGPVASVAVTRNGEPTGETLPLGASVELKSFDVDRYKAKYRVVLYKPSKERGWEMGSSYETQVGLQQKLADGSGFTVKAFYPDYYLSERAVPSEGSGAPALQVTVDDKPIWLMPGEKTRLESPDGKRAILFGWQRPELPASGPAHTLQVGDGEPQPIEIGGTLTLADGTQVKALRFLPHFTYDIEKKQALSLSDRPINPALEVEVGGATRWLFARMPGHDHGKGGPALRYAFNGDKSFETVLAVSGSERNVLVRRGDKEETVPLTDGLEIDGVRFGALLPKARMERTHATASDELRNPAVLLAVNDRGKTEEALMLASKQDAKRLSSGNVLTYEQRGDEVKAFRSHVVIHEGAAERKETVAVNGPVKVGAWHLYQVNFDPNDPKYSGLEAVRDPGVTWVFTGFVLMFLGVVYMIYVQPRMRRREA